MRKRVVKISLKIFIVVFISNLFVITLILNPQILYAKQTKIDTVTVYHNKTLPNGFTNLLRKSISRVKTSEVFSNKLAVDMCLNDGSFYPRIIEFIKGKGFAHGFYNKVVITSNIEVDKNTSEINGRIWNLEQLIAHEMIHCYQYNTYGLKTLNIPTWKLEGYAEYIARDIGLEKITSKEAIQSGWVNFKDGTGCPTTYYNDYIKVKKLMETSTYKEILNSTEK